MEHTRKQGTCEYIRRTIPSQRTARIKAFGRRFHARLNDLLIAAFVRAMARCGWDGRTPLRLASTIDLRRWYLPGGQAEAIANFSSLEILHIGKTPGACFEDTLRRVVAHTAKRKKNWIGLNMYAGVVTWLTGLNYHTMYRLFSMLEHRDVKSGAIFPTITNLGSLDSKECVFDKPAIEAWIIPPAAFPPFFGIGISGFNNEISISTAVFPQTRPLYDALFEYLLDELPH